MVLFGFYDEESKLYLIYPDRLYKVIRNFYASQGTEFQWSKATMCRELFLQGYLYKTENQDRPCIRRENPRTKMKESFLGILPKKMKITCRYIRNGEIFTK